MCAFCRSFFFSGFAQDCFWEQFVVRESEKVVVVVVVDDDDDDDDDDDVVVVVGYMSETISPRILDILALFSFSQSRSKIIQGTPEETPEPGH